MRVNRLNRLSIGCLIATCVGALSAHATPVGSISTMRFGFDGTIQRFESEADARSDVNQVGNDIMVEDRDISLVIQNGNEEALGDDVNIIQAPWWLTTDRFNFDTPQPDPTVDTGRAGFGNTRGNTGVGFLQLFDIDGSTDTSADFSFSDFDGSSYNEFNLSLTGENATRADDLARLSAIDNVNDGGEFLDFELTLTAFGLNGQATTVGGMPFIEAIGEPTGVTGSFTGLFELTENQTSPDNQGFFLFDFTLDMDSFAFSNRANLTPQVSIDGGASFFDGTFQESLFVAQADIPAPASLGLFAMGLAGLGVAMRRRRR